MALGLSGSNGGIGEAQEDTDLSVDLLNRPLEVSYFINNSCNLRCRHCYVGYEKQGEGLSLKEWESLFDQLIRMGALTFGNVGKEPLLSPQKTLGLLRYLRKRRDEYPMLRFGFVTNGTLFNGLVVEELGRILPNYIDVSLDGTEREHDYIRGEGNFRRTTENLRVLPESLKEKVFISFTLMSHNQDSFKRLVEKMSKLGLKKFLISPYIATPSSNGELAAPNERIVDFYQRIVDGNEVDFGRLRGLEILLKVDYDSQKPLMDALVERGTIDVKRLFIDNYGVIFNQYPQPNNSKVVINYIPFSDTLSRAIRISHDGYVGGCLEMFHKDYPTRTRGNLRERELSELIVTL